MTTLIAHFHNTVTNAADTEATDVIVVTKVGDVHLQRCFFIELRCRELLDDPVEQDREDLLFLRSDRELRSLHVQPRRSSRSQLVLRSHRDRRTEIEEFVMNFS